MSKSEEIDQQFIEDKPNLKKSLLKKSHSLKVSPAAIPVTPINYQNPSEDISLKSEEDVKNRHSDELMGSEIKVQISIDEAWKSKLFLKPDDELVEMLSDWTKKFEHLIHKINRFFKNKSNQFENDFRNLTNVLNEKIENVHCSLKEEKPYILIIFQGGKSQEING